MHNQSDRPPRRPEEPTRPQGLQVVSELKPFEVTTLPRSVTLHPHDTDRLEVHLDGKRIGFVWPLSVGSPGTIRWRYGWTPHEDGFWGDELGDAIQALIDSQPRGAA